MLPAVVNAAVPGYVVSGEFSREMPDPVSRKGALSVRADEQRYVARVGTTLRQKWRLDALIGLGGMAAVYAGTHRNGQRAAIKILHEHYARDPRVADRFLMEGYVANRVGHPGCVSVLDDDVSDTGEPFLVMELLEGETLRDFWKRIGRRVPPLDVLRICAQILDCLEACHAQGVIHRDLKPANIFLTKTNQVKVLDFGVAQLRYTTVNEAALAPTAVGTPAYMSPEQAKGLSDQLDGRTDLFSVGAIIHALCTGRRINHAKTEQDALVMAATTPVPSVALLAPDLPPATIAIIDKALAWDRRNRYSTAGEMRLAVLQAIDELQLGGSHVAGRASLEAGDYGPASQALPGRDAHAGGVHGPASAGEVKRPGISVPIEAERSHPVRDLLRHFDVILEHQRSLGWADPSTERALHAAHDAFTHALVKDRDLLRLAVRPGGFVFGRTPVWEPQAPYAAIAYNLYACGVRSLSIELGITAEEIRELLSVLVLDPARDLALEDDLVTVLWERRFPHVSYEASDVFTGGDATERDAFYEEADELAALATKSGLAFVSRLEATDDPHAGHPLGLDDVVRVMYQTQLELPRDRWRERYVEALIEGYVDSARNRDAHILLTGLRRSSATWIGRGRLDVVISMHAQILAHIGVRVSGNDIARLSTALTSALFGGDSLELVLDHLRRVPDETRRFAPVLVALPPTELTTVLGTLRAGAPEPLRQELLAFVAMVLPGREQQVAEAAAGSDTDTALRLAGLLGKVGSAAGRLALESLAESEDPALQIEVRVLLSPSVEIANAELARLLENASSELRMTALRALVRHGLRAAYPAIVRQVRAASFHDLAADERAELLRTSVMLDREHGEAMVLELVRKGGVFTSQARETSRAIAAWVLGQLATSDTTAEMLHELSVARWGISDETRAAAAAAASQIQARLRNPGGVA